ncbi:MAG: CBS domain-containing protein [Spirochaetales bacterium]|nr:CBS domain-containing protein [Spirochaetales bacterium]
MITGTIAQVKYVTVLPNTSTAAIEKKLSSHKYLVVQDKNDKFIGILTLSDVVTYAHKLVIDCVSTKPEIDYNTDLNELLSIMERNDHLVLPVFKDHHFYGIITYKDIIRFLYLEKAMKKSPLANEPELNLLISAGIIHDFNNILTFLFGLIEYADKETILTSFKDGMTRIREMTDQYMNYMKTGTLCRTNHNLKDLINEAIHFFVKKSIYEISVHFPPHDIIIWTEPSRFNQILGNLILNSIQAMPDGGSIAISADYSWKQGKNEKEQKCIWISFSDTGSGIDEDNISKIFQPFFTTKPDGTGMGLALVRYLIVQEGGTLTVKSKKGMGTTFDIFLPLHEDTGI